MHVLKSIRKVVDQEIYAMRCMVNFALNSEHTNRCDLHDVQTLKRGTFFFHGECLSFSSVVPNIFICDDNTCAGASIVNAIKIKYKRSEVQQIENTSSI